jgi:hypothetical protein
MEDRKDNMAKKNQEVKVQTTETEPIVRQVGGRNELAPITTQPLNSIESYLVWKAFSKLNDNEEVKTMIPSHKMDGIIEKTLRVRFGFTKDEDHETLAVQTAKPWRLLAVALNKLNGVSIDSIVAESENLDENAEKLAKKQAEQALAKIKSKTTKLIKGSVRVVGVSIEEVVG